MMTSDLDPRYPDPIRPSAFLNRWFVDPEQLICPGCGDRVRPEPPGYWRVADGLPVPQFSHRDGSALCRHRDGTVADPIEIEGLP